MSHPVLVVIDAQEAFVRPITTEPVLPALVKFTTTWLDAGRPVIMTRFINTPGSPFERILGWTAMQRSAECELHPSFRSLAERDGVTVIDKLVYSALAAPAFDALVREHGWDTFLLGGFSTHACVMKTALDLFERGLRPILLRDLVGSHNGLHLHAAALEILPRLIGTKNVISAEDALALFPLPS